MASTKVSNNIVRYSGETHPNKTILTILASGIDISQGWTVEIRYKVPTGTPLPNGTIATETTELVIDGVLTDPRAGKVNIYPHARLRYINGVLNTEKLTPDKYVTSELRNRLIAAGNYTEETAPKVNQVWDDDEVEMAGGSVEYPFYTVRVKDFEAMSIADGYQEEQVHNVGKIIITSRWSA